MYNLTCAATILLEEGYGIEAGSLARGLVDDMINVFYITNNNQIDPDTGTVFPPTFLHSGSLTINR